jgi:hypothetical protein
MQHSEPYLSNVEPSATSTVGLMEGLETHLKQAQPRPKAEAGAGQRRQLRYLS